MPRTKIWRGIQGMSMTRPSVKNSERYLPTAAGLGLSGVPRLTRRMPVFMDVLLDWANRTTQTRPGSPAGSDVQGAVSSGSEGGLFQRFSKRRVSMAHAPDVFCSRTVFHGDHSFSDHVGCTRSANVDPQDFIGC